MPPTPPIRIDLPVDAEATALVVRRLRSSPGYDQAVVDLARALETGAKVVCDYRIPAPGHIEEADATLPHSRACGLYCQGHGPACHTNCPTCHGQTWPPLTAMTPLNDPRPDIDRGSLFLLLVGLRGRLAAAAEALPRGGTVQVAVADAIPELDRFALACEFPGPWTDTETPPDPDRTATGVLAILDGHTARDLPGTTVDLVDRARLGDDDLVVVDRRGYHRHTRDSLAAEMADPTGILAPATPPAPGAHVAVFLPIDAAERVVSADDGGAGDPHVVRACAEGLRRIGRPAGHPPSMTDPDPEQAALQDEQAPGLAAALSHLQEAMDAGTDPALTEAVTDLLAVFHRLPVEGWHHLPTLGDTLALGIVLRRLLDEGQGDVRLIDTVPVQMVIDPGLTITVSAEEAEAFRTAGAPVQDWTIPPETPRSVPDPDLPGSDNVAHP